MAAAGTSLVGLTIVMLVAGAVITPQVTAQSLGARGRDARGHGDRGVRLGDHRDHAGRRRGQSTTGWLVERAGPSAAFLAGGVAGVLLAVVLWVRRHTLAPVPQPAAAPGALLSGGADQPRRYSSCARTDSSAAAHSTSSTSA